MGTLLKILPTCQAQIDGLEFVSALKGLVSSAATRIILLEKWSLCRLFFPEGMLQVESRINSRTTSNPGQLHAFPA